MEEEQGDSANLVAVGIIPSEDGKPALLDGERQKGTNGSRTFTRNYLVLCGILLRKSRVKSRSLIAESMDLHWTPKQSGRVEEAARDHVVEKRKHFFRNL